MVVAVEHPVVTVVVDMVVEVVVVGVKQVHSIELYLVVDEDRVALGNA